MHKIIFSNIGIKENKYTDSFFQSCEARVLTFGTMHLTRIFFSLGKPAPESTLLDVSCDHVNMSCDHVNMSCDHVNEKP